MTSRGCGLVAVSIFVCFAVGCGEDERGSDAGPRPDAQPAPDATTDAGVVSDSGVDGGVADTGVEHDGGTTPDAGGFTPPSYGRWEMYQPDGAFCSNGSPYKIFVSFSRTSDNVVIFLEGGGACWDYASCTGTGIRTAANRNGLRDDHATAHASISGINVPVEAVYPLLNGNPAVSPMAEWNKVFIPYCTGDVYSGDRTVTYEDPAGKGASVEFRHVGHVNIVRSVELLATMFESVPKMFVSGCSAGGAGAIVNYSTFRSGLDVGTGYLLDDSGPIYPDQGEGAWSLPLHQRVRTSWNADTLIQSSPMPGAIFADFGAVGSVLAEAYPNDRLALAQFRLDYNYSLYSYERFYEVDDETRDIVPFGDGKGLGGLGLDEDIARDRTAVYTMWWDDTARLRAQFDAHANLGYYMPFYRETNSSHCATIPGFGEFPPEQLIDLFLGDFPRLAWAGTEIDTSSVASMNVRDYVVHLLDDQAPLQSYFEENGEGRFLSCTPDLRYYDEAMCEAAN